MTSHEALKRHTVFSETVISEQCEHPPLLVVGLPRSGSSLLADLLTRSGFYYVFDDLYLQHEVERRGWEGPLRDEQLTEILEFLGWQIRARLNLKKFAVPQVTEADIDPMNAALRRTFAGRGVTWQTLQKEWLYRLARVSGCEAWGYNHPGAFLDLANLLSVYEDANVLFLFRAPERVLASFKYIPADHQDGHPDQYHPVAYAFYWRRAVEAYEQRKRERPAKVAAIRFEDLLADPNRAIGDTLRFFGLAPWNKVTLPEANSSFSGSGRKDLSGLEQRILSGIAGSAAERLGYGPFKTSARLRDVSDICGTTLRFTAFHSRKVLRDGGHLKQVLRLIGGGGRGT